VKGNVGIGFRDLVDGFLFSLRAEGKSNGTIEYYTYLLHPLLSYVGEPSLTSFHEAFEPGVIRAGANAFSSAEIPDRSVTAKAL
jgi:hypothetical protein